MLVKGTKKTGFTRSKYAPLFKILAIVGALLAVAALVIFVALPLIQGQEIGGQDTPQYNENQFQAPNEESKNKAVEDLSLLQREAMIKFNTINGAFMYGDEIVFSTASKQGNNSNFKTLMIFDTISEEATELDVNVKFANIVELQMNDRYIVWDDASANSGGRVMVYDRQTNTAKAIKEYAFGMPQLSLYENYLSFIQQAGDNLDRLYLVDLASGETTCFKLWEDLPAPPTPAHLSKEGLTYAITATKNGVLSGILYKVPLDGGEIQMLETDRVVYHPKAGGDYVAFLSSNTGAPTTLYLSKNMEMPVAIIEGVVNFEMGENYLVYTKEDVVYLYDCETEKHFRLNSDISKGILSSLCEDTVCWYDVTGDKGYEELNVVKYAHLERDNGKN